MPLHALVKSLFAYLDGSIQGIHFEVLFFPVKPVPPERLRSNFFLISTPYSSSAISIILLKKSTCSCFCPTTRSKSLICSFNNCSLRVSLLASTTCLMPFLRMYEYLYIQR